MFDDKHCQSLPVAAYQMGQIPLLSSFMVQSLLYMDV